MAEYLRSYIFYAFHSLTKYDYMAIGWILFLAFLLLILAAVTKRRILSYMMLFGGLLLLFAGPVAVKAVMDRYIRSAQAEVSKAKALRYSNSLLIEGYIKNSSRVDFDRCDLALIIYRPADNFLKKTANILKPLRTEVTSFDFKIGKGETKPFRIIVDHFNKHDFNISLQPRCYP